MAFERDFEGHRKGSAYVIPYRVAPEGHMQAFVGQKKVICYKAQERLELGQGDWTRVVSAATNTKFHTCMESRFNGLFFAAGGKPTCFGGKIETNETTREAAAREFLEESGISVKVSAEERLKLEKEIINNLVPVYQHSAPPFSGFYFSLDIEQCPLLAPHLSDENIFRENERIQKDEELCKKLPLRERVNSQLKKYVSEMHAVGWVDLPTLNTFLDQSGYEGEIGKYINDELQRGAKLFVNRIYDPENKIEAKKNINLYKRCRNFLTSHIPGELVDGNVRAAKKLQEKLQINSENKEKFEKEEAPEADNASKFSSPINLENKEKFEKEEAPEADSASKQVSSPTLFSPTSQALPPSKEEEPKPTIMNKSS